MRRFVLAPLTALLCAVAGPRPALSGPVAPIAPPALDSGKAAPSCRPPAAAPALTANQRNLAAMVAQPSDLCTGRGGGAAPAAPLAAAVGRYLAPPAEAAGASGGGEASGKAMKASQ